MGNRPVERPRQRWKEDVMEDLKKLIIKNWKETLKDRITWRDLAEKVKTHTGLYCQMMMMVMMVMMVDVAAAALPLVQKPSNELTGTWMIPRAF
jgi:hypothetical protein